MKKYILLFGCLIISFFLLNCKKQSDEEIIKNNLSALFTEFENNGNYLTLTVNTNFLGQSATATTHICADPFYMDLDDDKAYMQDGDFLFLYEFEEDRINRSFVGKMTDDSVNDLVDDVDLSELDLSKMTVSYDEDTDEYTLKFYGEIAYSFLYIYMGDLVLDTDTILDNLYVMTIKGNKDELNFKIETKIKVPGSILKKKLVIDICMARGQFTIPNTNRLYTQEPMSVYEVVYMTNVGEDQYITNYELGVGYTSYKKYHFDKGMYYFVFDDGKTTDKYDIQDGYTLYDSNYKRIASKKVIDIDTCSEYNWLFEITESGDYYLSVRAIGKGTKYRIMSYTNNHEAYDIAKIDNLSGKIEGLFDYQMMEITSDRIGALKITNNSSRSVFILYDKGNYYPRWEKKKIDSNDYFIFPISAGYNKMYIVSPFLSYSNSYSFDLDFEKVFSDDEKITIENDYGEEFNVFYGKDRECEIVITEEGSYTIELTNSRFLDAYIKKDYRVNVLTSGSIPTWYLKPGTYKVFMSVESPWYGAMFTTKAKLVKIDEDN